MFISFEGIDGSGKSTQIRSLAERLTSLGHQVICTREPGGSPGAEDIRGLLLSGDVSRWSAHTEILLFTAARRDHLEKCILPNLEAGRIVLCDRFVDSTRAYQGANSPERLSMVNALHKMMIGVSPDLTLFLDISPEKALARSLSRLSADQSTEDRFERAGLEFQKSLESVFREIIRSEPDRMRSVPADRDVEEIAEHVFEIVSLEIQLRSRNRENLFEI